MAQRIAQAILHLALVLGALHVDEVDHDEAAQVAQAKLPGHFVGRFQVGVERGLLDVVAARGARAVHVHRHEGLGVVDHDRAARGQRYVTPVGALDLVLDLEAREERDIVAVELDLADVGRHHRAHERERLVVDRLGVDEDLADFRLEQVADGAHHEARFEVDEAWALFLLGGLLDGVPELQQVIQVPLQLLRGASDARGARDEAHALGDLELVHHLAQLVAVLAFDPSRYPTPARVVGHQHEVASGERNVGGEGRALVAALVLVHLDDQVGSHPQVGGHLRAAELAAVVHHELLGDFLERKETMPLGAVIDEDGLQGRLYAGNNPFVDVALALFLAGGLDVEVDQLLSIYDRDPEFFRLGCVEKHALHRYFLPRSNTQEGPRSSRARATSCFRSRIY